MKGDVCRSRSVCHEMQKAKIKNEQLGREDVFSVHDDDNRQDGPIEMVTSDVCRAHLYVEKKFEVNQDTLDSLQRLRRSFIS